MIAQRQEKVTMPGGLWHNDTCHGQAEIRAVTGEDELFLAGLIPDALPIDCTTALLGRCVLRIGSHKDVNDDLVGELTVGDREALLLHLYRITLGDHLGCVVSCPAPLCNEKLDLELRSSELILPPYAHSAPRYDVKIEDAEGAYSIRFRLPRGSDQAVAARHVAEGAPGAAVRELISRCVEGVYDGKGKHLDNVPDQAAAKLPQILADHDPQAELKIRLSCPACGQEFSALLDTGLFLLRQLATDLDSLFREVHWLALHYHWSEPEILALSTPRRRRYLELLSDSAFAGGAG
jgi:hypothetical protein